MLVVLATKPDRRAKWVKAFGKGIVECDAPRKARELAAFIRAEAARQEVPLERGAAEALAERTGPQLLLLRHEIAKLALLAGPDAKVTRDHVGAGTAALAEAQGNGEGGSEGDAENTASLENLGDAKSAENAHHLDNVDSSNSSENSDGPKQPQSRESDSDDNHSSTNF